MQTESMTRRMAFFDLKAQFAGIRDEVMAAVARVMESQQFILGPEVSGFEDEIKSQVGCQHAFGCASGSDALLLALMALQVGPGDEVITVPFTFVATAGSIARLHAKPVFVDINPSTFNLDPDKLEAAITPRTRAIIPVHLFGLPADFDPILEVSTRHGVPVIEDAAQAIGAQYKGKPVGSLGLLSCFSFFPTKNLGGAGDGGLIATNDAALAAKLRLLRQHGSRTRYDYEILGINSRLDALQAAILRVKLQHLDDWTAGRQRNAARYRQLMEQRGLATHVQLPIIPAYATHIYHQFTIRVPYRDRLKAHLAEQGIPSEIYYPHPLHLQPAFADLAYREGSMPEAEAASREVLSLPIYPELSDEQLQSVVQAIVAFEDAAPGR